MVLYLAQRRQGLKGFAFRTLKGGVANGAIGRSSGVGSYPSRQAIKRGVRVLCFTAKGEGVLQTVSSECR